jgi:2'-5' RNA ligase
MSPLPTRMADHWWQRPGRSPGRLQYHWHVLFHGQPEVHRLAGLAQRKLAGVPGLDPVPLPWLHLTTLIVGFADEVSAEQVADMTSDARHRLAGVRPIPVTLGPVYYHPEAIVLPPEPLDALTPILDAVTAATRGAGCAGHADSDPWLPHISIAYSHGTEPMAPAIAALGRRLPEAGIVIRSVSLVAQTQVGRSWQWQPVAEVGLGPSGHPGPDGG